MIPKTIKLIGAAARATPKPVRFTFNGIPLKRKGFAFVDQNGMEILTMEPKYYSNGDKWLITGLFIHSNGFLLRYARNTRHALKLISVK